MTTFRRGHSAHDALARNRKIIEKISGEIHAKIVVNVSRRFEFPDPVDLRGIPATGKGVGGTIRGTKPESVIDKDAA